jgi:hypothetical protein
MTAVPNEVAHRRPANAPIRQQRPEPTVINGHVVRKDMGARLAGFAVSLILALIFAGFLLATV